MDCKGCQKPIPAARLEVVENAELCVSCQSSYEKKHPPRPDVGEAEAIMGDLDPEEKFV